MTEFESKEQKKQLSKLLDRGFKALSAGNLTETGNCCEAILKIKPDLVQAHFLVGLLGLESKERKTAFSAFQSVVHLDPDHAAAWAQLAKLYVTEGQMNDADKALKELMRIRADDPIVHDITGTVLSMMGEHTAAQGFFMRANQLTPKNPPFMQNLANNLVFFGDTEKSDQIFRDIVKLQSNSPQAHWALSGSSKAKDTSHINELKELLQRPNQHPRAMAFYYYAMGKEYEDLEDWGRAFSAFSKGAASRRETVEYDEQAEIDMFDYIKSKYTREWLDNQGEGCSDDSPIFVLGQPRTGTTLIERVITSHSQVHSAGELQHFGLALRRLSRYSDPRRFSKQLFEMTDDLQPEKIGNLYLQSTAKMRGDAPRFVDKLPQNYLLIPFILAALPNAKIVHLVRDPMDACFASFKQLFADAYLHSYEQEEMARHHARYLDLMNVWRERFPDRFFDIRYEDVASNLEDSAKSLLRYLRLPWEDQCLRFYEQSSAVSTASAVQVREPAHTRSIGRWRRYETELEPMRKALMTQK